MPRRPLALTLVSNDDGPAGRRRQLLADQGRPVACQPCSEHYGLETPAHIAMRPTTARRDRNGRLLFDSESLFCARCLSRGLTTRY